MNMKAAFVREGCRANIRGSNVLRHIRQFIDEAGNFTQCGEIRHAGDSHFYLQRRNDRREVAISHAFTVAVDGSLNLTGTGFDGGESVCDAESAVIVGMDADRAFEIGDHGRGDAVNFAGKSSAVCVAENEQVGSGIPRGAQCFQGILGVVLVAVEKMFGVVEDFAAVFFEMGHRVGDHGEVLLGSDIENLCDMQEPCLADDCDDRRLSLKKHAHLGIRLNSNAAATGATESCNAGIFPGELRRFGKKSGIARV